MKITIKSNNKNKSKINSELKKIKLNINGIYDSLYLPIQNTTEIKKLITEKKKLKPEKIIVVGIGGSNLGTKAIIDALDNDKIIFLDTVDTDKTKKILNNLPKKYLVNIISKSGSTTETIALAELILNKTNYKNVVVTTSQDSKLYKLATLQGYSTITIPKNVGGRYSVFSSVGLFPLGIAGIKIEELLKGAKKSLEDCKKNNNKAMQTASLIYSSKKTIHDSFIFDTYLESLGKWHRQLMAESLGKERNIKGKKINFGITPVVSIGSTDLHSMAQLNFGGPKDKVTNFILTNTKNSLKLPVWNEYDSLVKNIQGKKLDEIMTAIVKGVKKTYEKKNLPFYEIELEKTEYDLGYFMQFKMFETVYLASLAGVNPFNQPAVEAYKEHTRKLLSKR